MCSSIRVIIMSYTHNFKPVIICHLVTEIIVSCSLTPLLFYFCVFIDNFQNKKSVVRCVLVFKVTLADVAGCMYQ